MLRRVIGRAWRSWTIEMRSFAAALAVMAVVGFLAGVGRLPLLSLEAAAAFVVAVCLALYAALFSSRYKRL